MRIAILQYVYTHVAIHTPALQRIHKYYNTSVPRPLLLQTPGCPSTAQPPSIPLLLPVVLSFLRNLTPSSEVASARLRPRSAPSPSLTGECPRDGEGFVQKRGRVLKGLRRKVRRKVGARLKWALGPEGRFQPKNQLPEPQGKPVPSLQPNDHRGWGKRAETHTYT